MNSLVTVINQNTKAPIQGASVYSNGVFAATTDANGNANVSYTAGAIFSVKANGYVMSSHLTPASQVVADLAPLTLSITADLQVLLNPETHASGTVIFATDGVTTLDIPYSPGGVIFHGLNVGSVTVSGSVPGYNPFSQSVDTRQSTSVLVALSVASDDGGPLYPKTTQSADPNVTDILPPLAPEVVPEYTAPNTNQGTYFTMTQARMYIGDIFIDELNNVQFALQDNKIPIYGYASRFWDDVAQGKSLVQGQFTINFVSEGYLAVVLQNYKDKLNADNSTLTKQQKDNQQRLLYLVNSLQNPDPTWTPAQFTAAKREVQNLAANMSPSDVNAASAQIRIDRQNQINNVLGLDGGDYQNPIYSDVPFDIVLQYTGAGRTITRRLQLCNLISNESIMDQSGTPIQESYGFIARKLR